MKPQVVTLNVNGRAHHVALAPNVTLLTALRDLGYIDVKSGCEKAIAEPARSCWMARRSIAAWCWPGKQKTPRSSPLPG
jgi:hypothetical protein